MFKAFTVFHRADSEVLEDELAVVVQCNEDSQVVQPDQFGDPLRKVPATHTVSIFAADGEELHPVFKELGIPDPRDVV